jgi:hypothetical protein
MEKYTGNFLQSCNMPAGLRPQLCIILLSHSNRGVPAKLRKYRCFATDTGELARESGEVYSQYAHGYSVVTGGGGGDIRVVPGQTEVALLIAMLIPVWSAYWSLSAAGHECCWLSWQNLKRYSLQACLFE